MDNLSNELQKLKIDKSKRVEVRSGSRGTILMVIILLLAAGVAAAVMLYKPNQAPAVQVIRPRLESSAQSAVLVATGYVVAHHKIQVGSKIAGRVSWIGVEKGDKVRRDQVVVRLEDHEYRAQYEQARFSYDSAGAKLNELERGSRPEEIDRAKSDVDRAQAEVSMDESQLKRIEGLVREQVLAPQTLDDARGKYDTARANLASLIKTYELAKLGPRHEQIDGGRAEVQRAHAAMDYAKTMLDATEIHVPIDGTILERNVEQGEMVTTSFVGEQGAKSFVVTLADLKDLQVELDINQNDFNRIGPTQPCTVVTDAFPDRMYDCRVDEIAPEANRQKATVQVKVKFLEPDEYIRPEMNAKVTFLEADKKKEAGASPLYVVPKRAILDRETGKSVLVVTDGKVQVKPVTVQKEVGTDVYISAGLTGGEAIIIGDQLAQVKVGERVEIKQ
jgi:HlyD family secretion protein